MHFYSRASCEARQTRASFLRIYTHFYSRASCEARLEVPIAHTYNFLISTHAPLARRDIFVIFTVWRPMDFYSRASCEARPYLMGWDSDNSHFYSRASCEARRGIGSQNLFKTNFYSRASCEARQEMRICPRFLYLFLLTRLLRGATSASFIHDIIKKISTHAPLARRDQHAQIRRAFCFYFYSRASCEARLSPYTDSFTFALFLLTRLLRGATDCCSMAFATSSYFYSRASCEARQILPRFKRCYNKISTHAPLARRDRYN